MTLRLLAVPALALLCCCVIAGCASSGTAAYQEDAARLPRTAPTAQEMETPLSGNGHSALPRREEEAKAAPAQQAKAEPGDAGGPIEESLTIETKRLHGYSFPGMGQETAAPAVAPSAPAPAPAPPPAPAMDTGLETRVAALEAAQHAQAQTASRVLEEQLQAMENRLAELEGRPAQAVETRPEDLEQRFAELGQKLEKLEGRQTALSAGIPEVLNQRMQQMETQLAALENRPAQKVETTPEDVEQRFNEMSAKLATLENAQGGLEAPLRAEIQALENKLAQLENRPPQAVTVSSNNLEPRLAELRQQVEALGARGEPALAPDLSGIEERLAQTETKLAELGAEAPRVVDTTPEMVEERFQQLQAQVSALQQAQAAPPAPAEVVAAPSPSLPASPPMDASVYFEEAAIYRIGPGDQLEFTCFNDVLLSREEVLVRYDGRISLPLIPDIVVAGTTREEAEARVQNAYRSIFRNPRVSILVRGALSKVFTVVGDIQEPGMYPYEQPIRLIDAISLAGGLRDRSASAGTGGGFVGITGQLVKAFVVRRVEGERQVYEYDLRSLGKLGQHSSEAPVYPGDIIYVPEGVNLVYLLGEVDTRVVELLEGMTILQLLSLSGGFDATTARLSHVVLMRRVDDEHSEVMLVNLRRIFRNPDLDITLNPGDIVYVPQKRLVRLEEFIARFTGSISPLLGLYNDFIDARYSKRISEQLISNDTNVLQSLTELGASSAALLDVIQGNTN